MGDKPVLFMRFALAPGFSPAVDDYVGVDAENRVSRYSEYPIGRVSRVLGGSVEVMIGNRPPRANEVLRDIVSR